MAIVDIDREWTDQMEDQCDTFLKIHYPEMDDFNKDLVMNKMRYDFKNNINIDDVIRDNEEYKAKRREIEDNLRLKGIDPKQNLHEKNISDKSKQTDIMEEAENDLEKSIIY